MAGVARIRSGLVEQHQIAADGLFQRMACRAGYVFMSRFQRESCLVVVEKRWPPFVGVMATGAIIRSRPELIGVWVSMTISAIDRGFRELDVPHIELPFGWLVAVDTRHGSMRTGEREVGLGVVKFSQIFPLAR